MYQIVLLIHIFAAVCIVALVLIQQGKGASVGAAFGSGASQTVFGSRGSGSFLFRLTLGLAAIFFCTSLAMNYMATRSYKQERGLSLPMMPAPAKSAAPVSAAPAVTAPTAPATSVPAATEPVVPNVTVPGMPIVDAPVTLPIKNRS
jgi:preprotein translocase subunit SecG